MSVCDVAARLVEGNFGEGFRASVGHSVRLLERRLFAFQSTTEVSERVHAPALLELRRIGRLRRRCHGVGRGIDKVIVVLCPSPAVSQRPFPRAARRPGGGEGGEEGLERSRHTLWDELRLDDRLSRSLRGVLWSVTIISSSSEGSRDMTTTDAAADPCTRSADSNQTHPSLQIDAGKELPRRTST